MGRTGRTRNKKQINQGNFDLTSAIDLQKSLRLKCRNIKISYFKNTGRGVKSTRKINEGDVLIVIPLSQLITPAINCDLFSILNIEKYSAQMILSVWLIYEAHLKEKSNFFEYIQSLPHNYTNLYFCMEVETNLLPDFLKTELKIQRNHIKSVFDQLIEDLKNKRCTHCGIDLKALYSAEKFDWAWFSVNTRSVYYYDESNLQTLALAPFLDMFNHSNDAETEVFIDFKNKLYGLKTLVSFKKHKQVFIKYGPHSNFKLLIEYGFLLPKNPHDFVSFSIDEVMESIRKLNFNCDEIPKTKLNLIKKTNLSQNLSKNKEEFSWSFDALLYVLITGEQNISVIQSKIYSSNFNMTDCEKAQQIKKNLIAEKLRKFNETLLQMNSIKKSSDAFLNAKALIRMYINILQ